MGDPLNLVSTNFVSVILLAILSYGALIVPSAQAKSIGVFLPHVYSVKELQSVLEKDKTLGKYEIQVFARMKDLLATHNSSAFEILLVPGSFAKHRPNEMKPSHTLIRNGKAEINLHIVKLKDVKISNNHSIAAIDELGDRRQSKTMIKSRILNKIRRIKLVKKGVDLYPMLNLNNVTHILIDDTDMKKIMKESEVDFEIVDTITTPSPVFLTKSGRPKDYEELIQIEQTTFSFLGYDKVGTSK